MFIWTSSLSTLSSTLLTLELSLKPSLELSKTPPKPDYDLGIPDRYVPAEERYSEYQQDIFLDKIIFKEKKNGVFIEAGADDFIISSNSLYFEEKYNWTGILVEPVPTRFKLG